MSRRRGEFEHRTSIFEGAYRAWSHLGGLDPQDLETKPPDELDPLANPIAPEDDPRVSGDGTNNGRREYPYEPLPRSGLSHPFVQSILSPWLGSDADQEAISLGLTTLRTWWQHRRKGESGSAVAALNTDKMIRVVDDYTRHFFSLAHCFVITDKEQPPRSLHAKLKGREEYRRKVGLVVPKGRKMNGIDTTSMGGSIHSELIVDSSIGLSPLERLHAIQQRQLRLEQQQYQGMSTAQLMQPNMDLNKGHNMAAISVHRHANQLGHRGTDIMTPSGNMMVNNNSLSNTAGHHSLLSAQYGDPNTFPIVFCDARGEYQIAMSVKGITSAHCVKIVETVLRGCTGSRSPISGLLDAAADRIQCMLLVKIERPANAKRVAFEAARNLSMVGYTAQARETSIISPMKSSPYPLAALCLAFEATACVGTTNVFDWNMMCQCPDNGMLRDVCPKHAYMHPKLMEVFDQRGRDAMKYLEANPLIAANEIIKESLRDTYADNLVTMEQRMDFSFGVQPPSLYAPPEPVVGPSHQTTAVNLHAVEREAFSRPSFTRTSFNRRASRNPSILSFGGNGLRHMSLTSDNGTGTFGRAMSGLSALSIDWENLEDFDVDVDHSAHINNQSRASDGKSDNPRPFRV